jgi:membrane-associated phospholipid phosphatase
MKRVRNPLPIFAAIIAILVAHWLDPWAWERVGVPGIYDRDWGRMLRVAGSLVFWCPLAVAVWLEDRSRQPAPSGGTWLLWVSPAVAGGMSELLKLVIRRERPGPHDGGYFFRPFADRLWDSRDLGLPSGHTMVAFGGAAILARLFPRAAPVAYLLAAGSGLSRVMAKAHFLSDAMVGALAGWLVGALLWRYFGRKPAGKPLN